MSTAIILEDEIIAANRLQRMITEVDPSIRIIDMFDTIEDTANYFHESKEHPDLIFMDIQVADGNSFELFSIVDIKSKIIFTTAYDDYAVKAFRKKAIDYLTKPIKIEELREAILKAKHFDSATTLDLPKPKYKELFLLRFGSKFHNLPVKNIAYVFSKNKISFFYSHDGNRAPSDYSMHEIEQLLDPAQFFRVNRQMIVNLSAIDSMQSHTASRIKLRLRPALSEEIVISTEKTKSFKEWLDR